MAPRHLRLKTWNLPPALRRPNPGVIADFPLPLSHRSSFPLLLPPGSGLTVTVLPPGAPFRTSSPFPLPSHVGRARMEAILPHLFSARSCGDLPGMLSWALPTLPESISCGSFLKRLQSLRLHSPLLPDFSSAALLSPHTCHLDNPRVPMTFPTFSPCTLPLAWYLDNVTSQLKCHFPKGASHDPHSLLQAGAA